MKLNPVSLNIGHVVGMFYDWPDCFYSGGLGANRNVSCKLGMKLAINIRIKITLRKICSPVKKHYFP